MASKILVEKRTALRRLQQGDELKEENLKQHDAALATQGTLPPPPNRRSEECIVSVASEADFIEHNGVKFYEGKTSLVPACYTEKGKGKVTGSIISRSQATRCSAKTISSCTDARIVGDGPSQPTRFPSETPLDDLKTWLYDPHTKVVRSKVLLQHPKFGARDLLNILSLAQTQIKSYREEITHLIDYGARAPYNLSKKNPALKARDEFLSMKIRDFEGVPRWGLEDDVLEAGREVEYLRGVIDELKEKIRAKVGRV